MRRENNSERLYSDVEGIFELDPRLRPKNEERLKRLLGMRRTSADTAIKWNRIHSRLFNAIVSREGVKK